MSARRRSALGTLLGGYRRRLLAPAFLPAGVAELVVQLWLLIVGVQR